MTFQEDLEFCDVISDDEIKRSSFVSNISFEDCFGLLSAYENIIIWPDTAI